MKPAAAKPALTPKLRFPEFRSATGWDAKPMGEVYSFKGNNSLSRDQLNYEQGSIKNIHYGDIHTKFSTLFDITKETVPLINPSESLDGSRPENDCVEGDMIFADASEDLADIGKSIEVVHLNGERLASGQHTILARPNGDNLVVGFGAYLFKSRHVRTQIQKESLGSKVLGVSATRLTKINLPLPSTKAEQQKIAALKTHKKGLMQQLFPREGETLPRLRFPEFQAAPEWEEKPLLEVAPLQRGFDLPSDEIRPGNVPIVYSNGPKGFHTTGMAKGPGIVTGRSGTIGRIHFVENGPYWPHNTSLWVTSFKGNFPRFASGSGLPTLNRNDAHSFVTGIPLDIKEQQRIATCLSSLDDLITAQNAKLSALKTHKKGLMQQLFPSPEEVEA